MPDTPDAIRSSAVPSRSAPSGPIGHSSAVPGDPATAAELVRLTIDGVELEVAKGTSILDAARQIGVRIPTLCHHEDLRSSGVCRVCVVAIDGMRTLQAACATPVNQPLTINTHTPEVRRARRHTIDLLLANHHGSCYTCRRNNNCELQSLAQEYGVDSFRFGHVESPRHPIDSSSSAIVHDPNKCVLCRRCVRTCSELQEIGCLTVVNRSDEARISTFAENELASAICINCGQCINRCPTGALGEQDQTDEIWAAIDNPEKFVVLQTAPSPRASIGECFGLPAGTSLTGQINTAARRMGFDAVFDTVQSADLTIMEEGTELILRLYNRLVKGDATIALPQFTSCSPGWVKYYEHFYPDMLENLSSAKSPQQMLGALLKTYYAEQAGLDPKDIVVVALMPCAAKKFECNRPEMCDSGYHDVDFGLTSRELAKMVAETGIDLPNLPPSDFDDPFGAGSSAGLIFGATGGVMEAALRTVIELVTSKQVEDFYDHAEITPVRGFEGARLIEIPIHEVGPVPALLQHLVPDWNWLQGTTLKVGVAHGIANAKRVVADIKAGGPFSECHFIEIMACPGGCLGGGGQPIPTTAAIRAQRTQALYAEATGYRLHKSHDNPVIQRLYTEFLTDGPCGHKAHKLLHTHYTRRGKWIL
ncbi:hydrogenase [Halorhodospira abdelmalekii]|nr:NADH-dependent [FeFe] hydrogenase, group A6 [Halorhodospira abdelmalekii]MBK1735430.1 hydrogenase [Halorhodospira abdelmalekii]